MPKVSILMSVFNETISEIKQSIESMLNQTFKEFEFIIVNDNPNRRDIQLLLEDYKRKDKRIKIISNESNIGLAMSLNKAASYAQASYIARMDADDISANNRLEIQYNTIKNNKYDLVCSSYEFINEKNEPIKQQVKIYSAKSIKNTLPFGNVIHHPTVMFKKSSFEKVGGYRNFDCSQDYDLWLRFLYEEMNFYMLSDVLLYYRIRSNSISSSKRIEQSYTSIYIRNLFIQRLKKGKDNYSYEDYQLFLDKKTLKKNNSMEKVNEHYKMLVKSHKYYNKRFYFKAFILRLKVFIISKVYRDTYFSKVKMSLYKKRMIENIDIV